MNRSLICVLALAAGACLGVLGAGSLVAASNDPEPVPEAATATPEQTAVEQYNAGLELRDKAMEADRAAQAATETKKRAKQEAKRDELFGKAARHFETAIENNPDFAQAHGSLGYALRRLGRFEEAMEAYDTALRINPNYPEAMEYRAEALLGLGRLADAQESYEKLSILSAEHAAELLTAIEDWAGREENAASAAEAGLGSWIAQRHETLGAMAPGGQDGSGSWR